VIEDALTIVWKDVKEIARGGMRGGAARVLILLGVFGVLLPLQMGAAWLRWTAVPMLSWIALMLVSTVIADSFAGERERHTLETLLATRLSEGAILLGKLVAAVGYAWALVIACAVLGVATVNVTRSAGAGLLLPGAAVTVGTLLLTLLSALFAGSFGVLVSLRAATVKQAQQTVTLPLTLIPLAVMLSARYVPRDTRAAIVRAIAGAGAMGAILCVAGGLLVVDVALLALARARFRREKLIAP
jgi:ABC-2 type transport system permease protein